MHSGKQSSNSVILASFLSAVQGGMIELMVLEVRKVGRRVILLPRWATITRCSDMI